MNDEYLWSKEGNDREIERLEDLLSEFRFVPGPAPKLPTAEGASIIEPRRSFRWVFALATPAFAAFLFAVWFFLPANESAVQSRVIGTASAAQNYQPSASQPVELTAVTTGDRKDSNLRKRVPAVVKTVFRSHRSKRERIESLVAKNQLSAEEKYAYDRLMLALSIAGTKLKVVQDTIDRKSDTEKSSLRNEK
jgi:hypothetical protein